MPAHIALDSGRDIAVKRVHGERQRDPPWLPDARCRRRRADRSECRRAPKRRCRRDQNLAAPDRPVRCRSRFRRRRCRSQGREAVLSHRARHVRVVVLDWNLRRLRAATRVRRRHVVRVQVVGDDARAELEEPLHALDGLGVRVEGLEIFEIADMRAEPRARCPCARQNVFLSSAPQPSTGRSTGAWQRNRPGNVAARSPQHRGMIRDDGHDRVVAARLDFAVVHHEQIRNRRRDARSASASSVAIGSSDRLADVITSGRAVSASRRWCKRRVRQEQRRSSGCAAPRPRQSRAPALSARSTMGRSTDVSNRRSTGPTQPSVCRFAIGSRTITASGFSSRRFRSRSRWTAASDAHHRQDEIRQCP